jgi:hypothetical protein
LVKPISSSAIPSSRYQQPSQFVQYSVIDLQSHQQGSRPIYQFSSPISHIYIRGLTALINPAPSFVIHLFFNAFP